MKKVLLLDSQYKAGGPKTVNNNITHSYLRNKYIFKQICKEGVFHYNPFKAIKYVCELVKEINKEKGDVALVRGLQYIGLLLTIAAKISNVKRTIIIVHGSDWDVPEKSIRRFLLKYIVEPIEVFLADNIFTVCKAEYTTAKCLRCAKRGAYLGTIYNTFPNIDYNSIPKGKLRSMLNIQEDKIIVASVGRVVVRKGHQYIIDAIKKLRDDSYVYVIIGDGEYLKEYRKQCSKEINEHRLFLLGNRTDVYDLLKDVDIFLFATLNENHSLALLEAIAMHCAVIATNVGGNPETINDRKNGLLIPPANSEAIIQSLEYLKEPSIRNKFVHEAYKYAKKKFSVENTIGKLDQILDQ